MPHCHLCAVVQSSSGERLKHRREDNTDAHVIMGLMMNLNLLHRLHIRRSQVKEMKAFPPVATINTIIKALNSLKRIDEVMELWHVTGRPQEE